MSAALSEMDLVPQHYTFMGVLECIMTNLDHKVDAGIEKIVRNGPFFAAYAAYSFHGMVWWCCETSLWKCRISIWGEAIETVSGGSLQGIMDYCCDRWGSE